MRRVALLGAGLMGAPFARHLVKQGLEVSLYNRTRSKAEAIEGAEVHDTPIEAARGAELLFSVLSDDQAVLETVDRELLQALAPEGVHLSCSTISVAATEELVASAAETDRRHISCPFLGRPDFVEKKAHQFLFSGEIDDRIEIIELLEKTCKQVVDFGDDPLSAVRGKLATNFLIAGAVVAMGEAFAMLEQAGIDPSKAHELWTSSLFDCPLYKNYGKKILARDFEEPLFRLALGFKDTSLIVEEARSNGSSHHLMTAVKDQFEKSMEAGDGELDWTGVTRLIRAEG